MPYFATFLDGALRGYYAPRGKPSPLQHAETLPFDVRISTCRLDHKCIVVPRSRQERRGVDIVDGDAVALIHFMRGAAEITCAAGLWAEILLPNNETLGGEDSDIRQKLQAPLLARS